MDVTRLAMEDFELYVLLACRFAGFMVSAPFFGGEAAPKRVKVLLALGLAVMLAPFTPSAHLQGVGGLGERGLEWLVATGASELALGLLCGFASGFLFTAVQLAGTYAGQQIGFAIANVIDPISNVSVSILAQLFFVISLLVFIGTDGHLLLFAAMVRTLSLVPLSTVIFREETAALVVFGEENYVSQMFALSVSLAAPVMVILLLTTIVLGFLAKVAPEANVFVIGFTLRILGGIFVILILIPFMAQIVADRIPDVAGALLDVAATMAP